MAAGAVRRGRADADAGQTVSLQDLRGKFVVINFWATWCEPCIREWPQLDRLAERLQGRDDVVVLAISVDQDQSLVAPFLARMGLEQSSVRVLWDPTGKLHTQYGSDNRLDNLPCVLLETYDFAEVLAMLDRVTAVGGQATVNGEPFPPDPPPLLAEGVSLLEFGQPVLAILRADEDALEVRDHAIRWTGAHSNERAHVLRTRWRWSELPTDPVERLQVVRPAMEAAVAARRASFFECRLCQQVTEPEWRYREGICTECAEKRLGVVF